MLRLAPISCSDKTGIDTITIRRLRTASPSITSVIAFAGNGCQRSSLTAEAVECRRHVFARIVSEMVNPEQARERLLVGAAPPGIQLQCATAFTRSYRELPDFTGIGAASEATNLPCGGGLVERPGEAHDASPAFGGLRSSCDRSHRVLANLIPNLQHD